jgi:hypothetical protein
LASLTEIWFITNFFIQIKHLSRILGGGIEAFPVYDNREARIYGDQEGSSQKDSGKEVSK